MLKFKKKDLNQPVTLGVFVEFVDFVGDNVAMKKDVEASTEKILASNDALMHEVKAMREESRARLTRRSRGDLLTSPWSVGGVSRSFRVRPWCGTG